MQRDQLISTIAWEFRKLLYVQQTIFTSAKFPGFDVTVDSSAIAFQAKVCAVMHSAFYLRDKVGEASHVNMLNKQLESLEKLVAQNTANRPAAVVSQFQQPMQFQQQQQPMQFQQQNPNMAGGINAMAVPLAPQFGQPPPMFPAPPHPMQFPVPPPGFPPGQTMPMQPGMMMGGMQMMHQPSQQIMMQQPPPPQHFMGQMPNLNHFQRGQQNRPR